MNRIDILVGLVVGLCVGMTVGWWARGTGNTSHSSAALNSNTSEIVSASTAPSDEPILESPSAQMKQLGNPPLDAPRSDLAGDDREVVQLEPRTIEALSARVQDLERKLSFEKLLRETSEGRAVDAPKKLDRKYEGEVMRNTINGAFDELGLDAEVTTVDCSEYPCLLFGEGFGTREQSEKLRGTEAFDIYDNGHNGVWGWAKEDGAGERHQYFGLAIYSKETDDNRKSSLKKRIAWRMQQMQEAL